MAMLSWIVLTLPLMSTFDPEHMRIMGHALRIIGTFLENYRRYVFWEFENSIMGKN